MAEEALAPLDAPTQDAPTQDAPTQDAPTQEEGSPCISELEARIETLTRRLNFLSRHVVVLEQDLAIRRLQGRIGIMDRLSTWFNRVLLRD